MPIRDNTDARALLSSIDAEALRTDLDCWLNERVNGRDRNALSQQEMEKLFQSVDSLIQSKYGVDVWDAMMLLNIAQQDAGIDQTSELDDWRTLYEAVQKVCMKYGQEDPYGQGDFWLVDDSWGGASQKLIVTSPNFLTPSLVDELVGCIAQTQLTDAQILVSLELNLPNGLFAPPVGLSIDSRGATQNWDLNQLRSLVGASFFTDGPEEPAPDVPTP